jgi:hypothetical protein
MWRQARELIGNPIGENLGIRTRVHHCVLAPPTCRSGSCCFDNRQNIGGLFVLLLDARVDFLAVDPHVRRGLDSDLNPAGANSYDRELDAIADDDRFAWSSGENEHGSCPSWMSPA